MYRYEYYKGVNCGIIGSASAVRFRMRMSELKNFLQTRAELNGSARGTCSGGARFKLGMHGGSEPNFATEQRRSLAADR